MEDIAYQVFEHLYASTDIDSVEDGVVEHVISCRQALARSARTCKAFTYLALAALWRSLPSDEPLLQLLCILGVAKNSSEHAPTSPSTDGSAEGRGFCIPVSDRSTLLRLTL